MLRISFLVCVCLIALCPVGVMAMTHQVNMVNFAFVPETLTIQQGDTVLWVNQGSMSHTSTSGTNGVPDGVWDSGLISPGNSFAFAFDTLTGNFPYYCTPHWQLGMIGLIISTATAVDEYISPPSFRLLESNPNPFSAKVEFRFGMYAAGTLKIRIFNSLGQPVKYTRHAYEHAGHYVISWDGRNNKGEKLPVGTYFVRMASGPETFYAKITLIR